MILLKTEMSFLMQFPVLNIGERLVAEAAAQSLSLQVLRSSGVTLLMELPHVDISEDEVAVSAVESVLIISHLDWSFRCWTRINLLLDEVNPLLIIQFGQVLIQLILNNYLSFWHLWHPGGVESDH